jgi:adenylosuccinate lyase
MALVLAIAEQAGPYGEYVHFGATSNDILDTALALQLKQAIYLIRSRLISLTRAIIERGRDALDLICLGRTHGMAALPMPFGFKFAVWASIMKNNLERLSSVESRVVRGKISGAIGTMASFYGKGREIQSLVMKELGLKEGEISTQIVPRDSLAELISTLALISSTLELMANEIRNLQRTEIGEVEEPFRKERQVGSSTMPHKRNPIRSEKVCGLARIMRGLSVAALENIVLEHERDLSNSSVERIIVPEAFLILDEQLRTLEYVIKNLVLKEEAMKKNLERAGDLIMAERIMLELARRQMGRQKAHELVRKLSMRALEEKKSFHDVLLEEKAVLEKISKEEIGSLLDPSTYLGESKDLAEGIFRSIEEFLDSIAT